MNKLILTIAACAVAAVTLSGCNFKEPATPEVGGGGAAVDFSASAVFTASSDVLELSKDTSVKDYLDALAGDGAIVIEGYTGDYGYYVTSVNGLAESSSVTESVSSGYSWMLYSDFMQEDGTVYADPEYGTFEYGEKTLASASYGISYMPCVEGYTYALVYQAWSYAA